MRLTAGQQHRADRYRPHRSGTTSTRDPFFTQSTCSRCPNPLSARTMSWFNKDTICMECSAKEQVIKTALRAKGIADAMEGCGFIPNPEKQEATNNQQSK